MKWIGATGFLVLMLFIEAHAQYFGRNKPQYENFEFTTSESPHLTLYHYLKNDSLVRSLLDDGEYWYHQHQLIFHDTLKERNPVIVYSNHADFSQTTAISGQIGVGTGGVTEALRTRVVMPVMEVNAQTHHVLGHELVHVFQYRMLKSSSDSLSLSNVQNIPLWMVEGLAEYMSIGNVDPNTAMWMRDAVREDDVPSLKDMTRSYEYFPYRYGEAFWALMGGAYGDTIIYPLFRNTAMFGYDKALKLVTGLDEKAFSNAWQQRIKTYYKSFRPDLADSMAGQKLIGKEKGGEMNIGPVLSPNGLYVAFISEKNLFTLDLMLADARTGEVLKTLSSEAKQSDVDNLSSIESAGTWSPLSDRFAFVVYGEGRTLLSIVDMGSRNVKMVDIPGLQQFNNPSWSPDGSSIVVSGMTQGREDLYVFNLRSRKVTQLMDDDYSDIQPQWSPDGTQIAFVSDRPATGRSYNMRSLQLCVMNVDDRSIKVLDLFPGAENLNPVFAPDGHSIYFLSDRDGYRNLYSYHMDNDALFRLTDYFTGISGITPYSPAISVCSGNGRVAYTYYADKDYTIYVAEPSDFKAVAVDRYEVDFAPGTLPPLERSVRLVNPDYVSALGTSVETEAVEKPYRPRFKLEYIGNSVGVGISNGGFGTRTGGSGGVDMLFGDILEYHRLYASLSLNGQVYDFGGQAIYLNQRHRLNWGVSLGHIPYVSAGMTLKSDTLTIDDEEVPVDNIELDVFRAFEENGGVFAWWPLSTTRRFELGTDYSLVSFRIDRYNNYYYQGAPIGQGHERRDAPPGYRLGSTYGAYVFDNSYFGIASPLRGKRYRFELETTYDELSYNTATLDYRHYFFLNPTAFAVRGIFIDRFGSDARSNRITPLSFAYTTLTRGNNLDNLDGYASTTDSPYSINQIFGSKMLVANVEYRIPFSGPERLSMIKSKYLLTELALFVDGGLAFNDFREVSLTWDPESGNTRIPFLSTGVSLRINLFGQLILEPYYAVPFRGDHFEKGQFGLNFTPGW